MTISIGSVADLVAALDSEKSHEAIAAATVEVGSREGLAPGSRLITGKANNKRVLELWGAKEIAKIDPYRSPHLIGPVLVDSWERPGQIWTASVEYFAITD